MKSKIKTIESKIKQSSINKMLNLHKIKTEQYDRFEKFILDVLAVYSKNKF